MIKYGSNFNFLSFATMAALMKDSFLLADSKFGG